MDSLDIQKARTRLDELVNRVADGEGGVILEAGGKPLAMLIPVEDSQTPSPEDGDSLLRAHRELKHRLDDAKRRNRELRETLAREVAERETAQRQSRAAHDLFVHTERLAKLGHWDFDEVEDKMLYASEEMARLHGCTICEFLEAADSLEGDIGRVHPDDRARFKAAAMAFKKEPTRSEIEYKLQQRNGQVIEVVELWQPILNESGELVRSVGIVQDISERKRIEAELRESEDRFKSAARLANLGHYVWDQKEDKCIFCSEEYARIHGVTVDEYMASPPSVKEDVEWLHPDDREAYLTVVKMSSEELEPLDVEFRIVRSDGEVRHVHEREIQVLVSDGKVVRSEGIVQDITALKQVEERLRQSQKMEAVGQLTGGVAHDFNNLLAIIQGNAELLSEISQTDLSKVQTILRASARGAELTQRLLAFSRQQPLQPQSIELENLVKGMSDLLVRTLGETVEVNVLAADGLWPVRADPSQLENALLNLAINARDAMPGGGKLTIECVNAQLDDDYQTRNPDALAGNYVMLAVTDSGVGMTQEILERAFEPFFTTKEVGQGTGLGLSMIYGFAKQSEGHVKIYSEEDLGTTVKFYLPRDESTAVPMQAESPAPEPRGRGEVILIIEDNEDVRMLACELLEGIDYQVIGVPETASARAELQRGERVDLVLSDVILPGGQSGPDFAQEIKPDYPDLPIIFMSGYPAEAAARNGFVGSDKVLLNKPFRRHQLARAISQALARKNAKSPD